MKTWKVKHKHGYSEVEADSCTFKDGLLEFFKTNDGYFGTSIGGVEYWHEIGSRHYPPKTETPEMRIHRLETDRNELRATLLALQATVDDMQVMLDANNL